MSLLEMSAAGLPSWETPAPPLPTISFVLDPRPPHRVRHVSESIRRWTGRPVSDFCADPWLWESLVHPDDAGRFSGQRSHAHRLHRPLDCEFRIVDPGGRVIEAWERAELLRGPDGVPIAVQGVVVDVTGLGEHERDRRFADEQIALGGHYDVLTCLPDERGHAHHLDRALARIRRTGRAVALVSIDLDDFTLVNDALGHRAADGLLVQVAARLQRVCAPEIVLSRPGGDELRAIVCDLDPATARDDARAVAERLLDALAEPFEVGGETVRLSGSAGVSTVAADEEPHGLLYHAQSAMIAAKRDGRGRVRCNERGASLGDPRDRLVLAGGLPGAIERGELVLHWQPIVDAGTGEVHAVEALVRWQHPERGLLGPGAFVPHAERSSLIEQLGAHVLDLACAQQARWEHDGLELPISVNVSPRQLQAADFAAGLRRTLERHGRRPDGLIVEVTESAVTGEAGEAALRELAALGVRIAIDDFGAGFSSLGRLIDLPVHMLKVDRSFLTRAASDAAAAAVLSSVVALGGSLDLPTVAEGVETEEQRDLLLALDCRLAQGFLFARPVAADELEPLLGAMPVAA
jgi:diguanylate cyclase (GGDEF)-like protein